jgi:CRP/FNR family nitrogen fixation transcriptional regulator
MNSTAVRLRAVADDDLVSAEIQHHGISGHLERLKDHAVRLRFHRGNTIAAAGDAAAHIYVVSAGCLRLTHHGKDGRRHIADFLFGGDIWGLGDAHNFALSAEAVSPTTITAYPRQQFDRLGEGNNRLRSEIFAHLSDSIQRAHRHLYLLSCLSARERVATFLTRMMQKSQLVYGARLDLPMGRQDIADHLGLTVETVCRALAALKAESVIEVPNAHLVVVRDGSALSAVAGEPSLS